MIKAVSIIVPKEQVLKERSTEMAKHYTDGKGYAIKETDWGCKQGSIDFIVDDDGTLVFIKLLYRESDDGKLPEEMSTKGSRAKFESLAAKYLAQHSRPSE